MRSDNFETLKAAIGTGEILGILYDGGSNPGAFRRILPLQIKDNRLRARCYTSNAVKVFFIDRITIKANGAVGAEKNATIWAAKPRWNSHLATIAEVAATYKTALEAMGWHTSVDLGPEGDYLHAHAFFKNGKPKRSPSITLSYEATTYDLTVTPEGGIAHSNVRPRVRPWGVSNASKSRTWSSIDSALIEFLTAAGL